jgi:hypothetical protein
MWFWKKRVAPRALVQKYYFGDSTMAINGGWECGSAQYANKAKRRFVLYNRTLIAFNVKDTPIEAGCY